MEEALYIYKLSRHVYYFIFVATFMALETCILAVIKCLELNGLVIAIETRSSLDVS